MKKLIVDTLGADNGCFPIVCGVLKAMAERDDFSVVFAGDKSEIEKIVCSRGFGFDRIEILHTKSFVADSDLPTCVFRGGDDTSMVMSLEKLRDDVDACAMICAGNTGALLVGTICRLGLVKGLMSPVLATAIPCKKDGLVCLVDCGANTDCKSEDLKNFALMGNAYMQSLAGLESPKVALMSVGQSPHKGNALVKEAYALIEKLPINFIGNIEGTHLVNSPADVVVTDGFTGNVLLKNTEAAGMAAIEIVDELASGTEVHDKLKNALHSMFAFNDLGGATFLGAKKPVVKMHGCANEKTAYECVKLALTLDSGDLSNRIHNALC